MWKFKSCGDFLFPASAPGYFVFRFPEIRSVPACVCFSCLTTKSSQSGQRCLVWCSQQLKHIPLFTHFFLLVLSVCTTSSRRLCHKGRPGIQCMPRFVRLLQYDACLGRAEGGRRLQERIRGGRVFSGLRLQIRCLSATLHCPSTCSFCGNSTGVSSSRTLKSLKVLK